MTPQRRAILAEILSSNGHINLGELTGRVQERLPGVNAATVYRTLWFIDDMGVISTRIWKKGLNITPKVPPNMCTSPVQAVGSARA